MDEVKLLKLLESDGELSNKEISQMLGVGESEVVEKIESLKSDGVLKKCKAIVDWKKLNGRHAGAVIQVKVVPQEQLGFDKICREVSKDVRVSDVYVVTGEYDMMIIVHAENLDEISDFVTEKLAPKKEVVGTYTHILLNTYKRDGVIFSDEREKRLQVTP